MPREVDGLSYFPVSLESEGNYNATSLSFASNLEDNSSINSMPLRPVSREQTRSADHQGNNNQAVRKRDFLTSLNSLSKCETDTVTGLLSHLQKSVVTIETYISQKEKDMSRLTKVRF